MIPFTKMHGAANDYVYLNLFDDHFGGELAHDAVGLARRIADRRTGVGGDGLILIAPPTDAGIADGANGRMVMFNADGSEAEMCGNGVRCVAKFVHDHVLAGQPDIVNIETRIGVLPIEVVARDGYRASQLRVDMGPPVLDAASIPTTLDGSPPLRQRLDVDLSGCGIDAVHVTAISMGNPHAVCFFDDHALVTDQLVQTLGPRIEHHPAFPNRTNVEFVTCPPGGDATEFSQRTWERGSGETFACGTGAAAVAVAGILEGRLASRSTGHLLGGDLTLEWEGGGEPVYKTGPAVEVFSGVFDETTE